MVKCTCYCWKLKTSEVKTKHFLLFLGATLHHDSRTSTPCEFDVSELVTDATVTDTTQQSCLLAPFSQLRLLNLAQNKVSFLLKILL